MSAFSVAAFTVAWWLSAAAFGRFVVVMSDSASRHTRLIALIFALLAAGIHFATAATLYPIVFPLENV